MESEDSITTTTTPLSEAEFDRIKCNKCNGYLNCPPIMAYLGTDYNYLECGRCFDEEAAKTASLRPVRNRPLELLATLTPFPCKNFENGCTERRVWPQIEIHEKECLHRGLICPLSVLKGCEYRAGMQKLLEHFQEQHLELFVNDGKFKENFNKDFENYYLVHQNSNLFVLQVKCDVHLKKVWFLAYLLEQGDSVEFSVKFSHEISSSSFTVKLWTVFEPLTTLDTSKALEIGLDTIKGVLKEADNVTCTVNISNTFPAFHSVELLKEIQCPACWVFMRQKIFLCKNGHNICSKCKEFVKHCPTCRDDVLDIRNLSLEKLMMFGLFPCKHISAGCTYVGTLEEMIYHLKYCRFND